MTTDNGVQELEAQLAEALQRIQVLETRLDRWAQNGLRILDSGKLYGGAGGLYGTGTQPARIDHTH